MDELDFKLFVKFLENYYVINEWKPIIEKMTNSKLKPLISEEQHNNYIKLYKLINQNINN